MIIEVDDKTALVDKQMFDELYDYSCSLPSGTIIGKRWKRDCNFRYEGRLPDWYLGEYTSCDIPGQIGIKWRKLYVL